LPKTKLCCLVTNQKVPTPQAIARISIISLPFAGAWFCAGQYTKLKNIAEDYAYKTNDTVHIAKDKALLSCH
jgi:hypothetical protein